MTTTLITALMLSLGPLGTSRATPVNQAATPTVNLSDVPGIDALPVCAEEDCSDQVGQVGMWLDRDTGNWYLELGESETYLVIDDTVTR